MRPLLLLVATFLAVTTAGCGAFGAEDDKPGGGHKETAVETQFDVELEPADLPEVGLTREDLDSISEEGAILGNDSVIQNNSALIEFLDGAQPELDGAALDRRLSRLAVSLGHGRTFILGNGRSGVIQVLLLFENAEDAAEYLASPPAGYEEAGVERESENIADETVGYEAEFDTDNGPTGFGTVLTRYNNLVSQVVVGTIDINDPFIAAEELTRRQDERLRAFFAGDSLTTLAEESELLARPDPRALQLLDFLLVDSDLDAYGQFEVLAETPNDNAEAVIAFLSNAESIAEELSDLLASSGFVTGYGRLLSNGQQDEGGLAVVTQALLFDTADGALAFAGGSTDLDTGALAATSHDVLVGDGARAFCRTRDNGNWDCELRFSRDNIFAAVAVLNFADEAAGLAAATALAQVMDGLIQDRA
ncbi:MAG: hypothetical protein WEB00_05550 [Dehalococcoidia bacterium]